MTKGNMKKFIFTLIMISSLVFLAGCQLLSSNDSQKTEDEKMMETIEAGGVPHQVPVSGSTDLDVLESELEGTVILEEDFSDL